MAQSVVLHQLDKAHLTEVLKNPFLQASELEVLHAVLKWGEHELVRRMEDRGENILFYGCYNGCVLTISCIIIFQNQIC